VRNLRREGLLRPGQDFSWSLKVGGEPSGRIRSNVQTDAVLLTFEWRHPGISEWTRGSQRVSIVWTKCHLGGVRPWFLCTGRVDGCGCGRRAAKLCLGDSALFACRHCCGLAYTSQSENPRHRAISQAQKLRMRLSGSPSLLDPFPERPPRMHRLTYHRLFAKAMAAQERSLGLEIDDIRRRYPGLLGEENAAKS
jgi:hypothetical protein